MFGPSYFHTNYYQYNVSIIILFQGESGQSALKRYPTPEQAVKDFEKKFKDKTKNNWADRASFQPVAGKYTLIEMDGEEEDEEVQQTRVGKNMLTVV